MAYYDPVASTARLDRLWARGQAFLGCELPILCGAMTWISDPQLVSTVSNMGGFASLAGGNMPPEMFADVIDETRTLTDRPFAANIIVIAPNYRDHLELCCEKKLSHIVFAGSIPRQSEVQKAKDSGAKVVCFASTASMAKRMIRFGADALVLEGSEAGGHIGHVSTTVLLQDILFDYADELPIFVAGGIAHGAMIGHLCMMGAAGAQLGTRFVVAEECQAHPKFKEAFIKARAREAISTPQYSSKLPVVAVRALRNKAMDRFGDLQMELLEKLARGDINRVDAQYEVEKYWVGSLRDGAVDGDVERGSLMAGQSVGLVHEIQPMRTILQQLVDEADAAVGRAAERMR
ncbi:nitronate monooxygenase family protein [bacterium]|nr:nitronate monooxygenase family protein [bacterium]MBU1073745.1 nitronate monooxygenase family protein [bacterium]MBU1677117.1 nitronate monooxygenase family protein [bacterium]